MDLNLRHQLFIAAVNSGLITHQTPPVDVVLVLEGLMKGYEFALKSPEVAECHALKLGPPPCSLDPRMGFIQR